MENLGEIIIYQTEDGLTKLEVKMENDTVWVTQAQLVELYQSSKANVSEHIAHIFEEGELVKEAVVRKFRTTASDGKNYNVLYYNLDMIISLGYRINSATATRFRQWATQRLKEYISNILQIHNRNEFRQWLTIHSSKETECWITVKRGKPINPDVFYYLDAVEEALCFG